MAQTTYKPSTPNYDIDYNDPRFGKVESDRNQAMTELEQTYAGMIGSSDQFFDDQINASKEWADKQQQIQQEKTDFAIEQIEQQKDQAHKDYTKEQSGAYVDWQKQSNKYGVNAEQMASAGLTNTGFAETSQVGMYNTYQNRVATAREVYNKAILNYNNAIKDAQIQNNAALAELAFKALQQQLELSLEGFQYKNQLIMEQSNKKMEMDEIYNRRYQDVLAQINTENALAEEIRQYNETMAWNTEQAELERQFQARQAEIERQYQSYEAQLERDFKETQASLDRQHEEEQARLNREFQEEQAALERKHDKEMLAAETKAAKEKLRIQHNLEMQQLAKEQEYKMAQLDKQQRFEAEQNAIAQQNKMAQLDKQLANEKALAQYEYSLNNKSVGTITGNKGNSSVNGAGASKAAANGMIGFNGYTPSKTVQNLINSLASMRNQSGSKKAIANSICVYYDQGKISEKDCEYMLKYFGYNPDDYLE